jgi:hypothetical protein
VWHLYLPYLGLRYLGLLQGGIRTVLWWGLFGFGKYVFKLKWNKIVDDFNPMKGNLLGLGMVLLFFSPAIVFSFQQ